MSVVFVEFSVCVFRLTWCYNIIGREIYSKSSPRSVSRCIVESAPRRERALSLATLSL